MDSRFVEYLRKENARSAQEFSQRPFELELPGNVQIGRGADGGYVAVINGTVYPATADGERGLDKGIYHFEICNH